MQAAKGSMLSTIMADPELGIAHGDREDLIVILSAFQVRTCTPPVAVQSSEVPVLSYHRD
jgi:hypothetical protein